MQGQQAPAGVWGVPTNLPLSFIREDERRAHSAFCEARRRARAHSSIRRDYAMIGLPAREVPMFFLRFVMSAETRRLLIGIARKWGTSPRRALERIIKNAAAQERVTGQPYET